MGIAAVLAAMLVAAGPVIAAATDRASSRSDTPVRLVSQIGGGSRSTGPVIRPPRPGPPHWRGRPGLRPGSPDYLQRPGDRPGGPQRPEPPPRVPERPATPERPGEEPSIRGEGRGAATAPRYC